MSFAEFLNEGGLGWLLIAALAGFLYGCYVTEREQERWKRKR